MQAGEAPNVDIPSTLAESLRSAGANVRKIVFSDDLVQWNIDGIIYGSDAWKVY
jgi:hypothetical protein